MENKIIYIKLIKDCKPIQYFEESYSENKTRYYNFPSNHDVSYLNELTDKSEYYFFALVYENNGLENKINKAFLGTGCYSAENQSLNFLVKYASSECTTTKNLRMLSNLDIRDDFNRGEYVLIEESEYAIKQIDFILHLPYKHEIKTNRYGTIESEKNLHVLAQRNEYCRRQYNLRDPQPNRGEFQRDYERIVHSKAFRRMVDKAQVFSASKGDYYRTRMTHSQAVAQIARGIASELNLNMNLTEAIALGHDIGHTPFGHQGERTLNDILCDRIHVIKNCDLFKDHFGGFKHNYQSIRVASILEEEYAEIDGMDLSYQTLEGMLKHTKLRSDEFKLESFIEGDNIKSELFLEHDFCSTLEGQVVAIADEIAQRGHDLDDALSSGIMSLEAFEKFLTFKKAKSLRDRIINQNKQIQTYAEINHRRFVDENELKNSRAVSTIISYFINDIIKASRKRIDNYSVGDFKKNNHIITELLIYPSKESLALSQYLETIITNKVINSSEIALFDNNGATIVSSLFKAYYNDPRLLHKGTQRRIYIETRRCTANVVDFEFGNHKVISDEIKYITKEDLSDSNLDEVHREEYKLKRKILVRNICDFIAGMTDTYAINEYNRIAKQL